MLTYRFATAEDTDIYYNWANDPVTRSNSYNKGRITYEEHVKWFSAKRTSADAWLYVFLDEQGSPVGQITISADRLAGEAVIGISIDKDHRGKGYSSEMIRLATADIHHREPGVPVIANIFKMNIASQRAFTKAGFVRQAEKSIQNIPSYVFVSR